MQQQLMKSLVVGGAVVAPRNPPAEKTLRPPPWRLGLEENVLEATAPMLAEMVAVAAVV